MTEQIKKKGRFKKYVCIFAAAVAFTASLLAVIQYFRSLPEQNISGKWKLDLVIESSTHTQYLGLKVGYVIYLEQNGSAIKGKGEKWWENDQELPYSQHTPIELTGTIKDKTVKLLFDLHGAQRQTVGEFALKLRGETLTGVFSTTGANSSGHVVAKLVER